MTISISSLVIGCGLFFLSRCIYGSQYYVYAVSKKNADA